MDHQRALIGQQIRARIYFSNRLRTKNFSIISTNKQKIFHAENIWYENSVLSDLYNFFSKTCDSMLQQTNKWIFCMFVIQANCNCFRTLPTISVAKINAYIRNWRKSDSILLQIIYKSMVNAFSDRIFAGPKEFHSNMEMLLSTGDLQHLNDILWPMKRIEARIEEKGVINGRRSLLV